MIQVTIRTTAPTQVLNFSVDTTIREALESAGVNYAVGVTNLDGAVLNAGEINKTFADFGLTSGSRCTLVNVVKADGAIA